MNIQYSTVLRLFLLGSFLMLLPAIQGGVTAGIPKTANEILAASRFPADPSHDNDSKAGKKIRKQLENWKSPFPEWRHLGKVTLDSIALHSEQEVLQLFFSRPLSYLPVREESCEIMRRSVHSLLGRRYKSLALELFTDGQLLQELIPNLLRSEVPVDQQRGGASPAERIPLVWRASREVPAAGLFNNNIALWSSHGWYYESKLDRWEWQRARLFGTVEDLYTKSYVIPFLVPMLENSGATVLLPEERDGQKREAIADNDLSTGSGKVVWPQDVEPTVFPKGFLVKDTLFAGENPFLMGTSLLFNTLRQKNREVQFFPDVEPGEYGVYISWQSFGNSSNRVEVRVRNSSGEHIFHVNQQMGGGTWVYLGHFYFGDPSGSGVECSVAVNLSGQPGEVISIDAVRLGGGMGNVARRPASAVIANQRSLGEGAGEDTEAGAADPEQYKWKISGRSRYSEASRYYLQYAGFPDSLVYDLNRGKNDYNDDYMSRGEWVNFLMKKQENLPGEAAGLRIPVDLAFAFHTDAGISPDDSIIGTLAIYSTWAGEGKFPDGSSRMASRDLTDLVQTQIVSDIRAKYNPKWTRRGLWDRQYSEAWRPNVPAMLLELLSHQNLADMRFGLDPQFRFDISRAIYKGMARFLAARENREPVIHPLPVDHFVLTLIGDSAVTLSWKAVADPLEPTAIPQKYRVYTQSGGGGFDEGAVTVEPSVVIPLKQKGVIYDFRVTALNEGGESFPSETLSVGIAPEAKGEILVVNGFDRVAPPSFMDTGMKAGAEWWHDQGVEWGSGRATVGRQYDYDRSSPWTDDDSPGWGASHATLEDREIAGNSFDFCRIHGRAILNAGYSFVSVSQKAFCMKETDTSPFTAVDILLGEQKTTSGYSSRHPGQFRIYTPAFMEKIREIAARGGSLFLSGAYVASDPATTGDTLAIRFTREVLGVIHRTTHGSQSGRYEPVDEAGKWFTSGGRFNTGYSPEIYTVESPGGIEPAGKGSMTIFRYGDNNVSAGVALRGEHRCVTLGFPFETILSPEEADRLMIQILSFLEEK